MNTFKQSAIEILKNITNSPDRQNAKISSDKKLSDLMQKYLQAQIEIYKEFIFDTLWQNKEQLAQKEK